MSSRTLSSEEVLRMMSLAEKSFRPPQIIKMKEEIEGRTRQLELKSSITGEIDEGEILNIVDLKIELDLLYSKWVTGELK